MHIYQSTDSNCKFLYDTNLNELNIQGSAAWFYSCHFKMRYTNQCLNQAYGLTENSELKEPHQFI